MMASERTPLPGMGQAVFERTVGRIKPDGTRETWYEVAERVAYGNLLLDTRVARGSVVSEYVEMRDAIASAALLMSGRHQQHGDATQATKNLEMWTNCSTAPASFLSLLLLLSGCGVGRCYDDAMMLVDWNYMPIVIPVLSSKHPDYAGQFPTPKQYPKNDKRLWMQVEDSREGWAKALECLEWMAYERKFTDIEFVLDFSDVRAKGTPIHGMQDRPASGPVPLMQAFLDAFAVKGQRMPVWEQTMRVDHAFASCVAVGGARRAARIATKNWRDGGILNFIKLKSEGGLWSANNSVAVDAEFWHDLEQEDSWAMRVFNAVNQAAYHHGTGEPGFLNLHQLNFDRQGLDGYVDGKYAGSKKYSVSVPSEKLLADVARCAKKMVYPVIVNPCCVTGDTLVETIDGMQRVSDLLDGPQTLVVHGQATAATPFWETGTKPVFRVRTASGRYLRATADHLVQLGSGEWRQVADLQPGNNLQLDVHGKTAEESTTAVVDVVPDGIEPVYDCSVFAEHHSFSANGFIVHNCEIPLSLLGGYCTLGTVAPYFCDTLDQATRAFELAARALVRTNRMPALYQREVDRTNRIGVGVTGLFEFAWKFWGFTFYDLIADYDALMSDEPDSATAWLFWQYLESARNAAEQAADELSDALGVGRPHTVTMIAPTGTISKMWGLTEGAHLPAFREYLRWVQFQHGDPLIEDYRAKGYPVIDDVPDPMTGKGYKDVSLVGFPTQLLIRTLGIPDSRFVTASEASMESQFQWLTLLEKYWLGPRGNQISYTMKYEASKLDFQNYEALLRKWMPRVRCVSVLPTDAWSTTVEKYGYAPEEPITKQAYDRLQARIQQATEIVTLDELQCASGACPI